MPGRAKLKRAGIVLPLIAAAILVTGCASTDHSWRGEFDARLEGASAAIEARLGELQSGSTEGEMFTASQSLAHTLTFKAELIKKLDPPVGCEEVQEGGRRTVDSTAVISYTLLMDLTPELQRKLPGPFEERIAELGKIEAKSKTCA
jgi:hypothetical protein